MTARGAKVVGLDIASGQIEAAKESAKERKLADRTSFAVGTAGFAHKLSCLKFSLFCCRENGSKERNLRFGHGWTMLALVH